MHVTVSREGLNQHPLDHFGETYDLLRQFYSFTALTAMLNHDLVS